jgi:1-acyl-sn-glycerol-3-phosphate acyltransferase
MERAVGVSHVATSIRPGMLIRLWGIIATLLAVLYTIVLLPPAAIASLFVNGHLCSPIFRAWSWLIFRTCGISCEVEGLGNIEGLKSFVLVSNHQSLLDIMAVLLLVPREMRFLAKREIKKVPVIGFVMEHSENVVIDRSSGGKTIRRAMAVVSHGYSICVFAEGHRFSDNCVHQFSTGAAWLAIATGLPCVPMAIEGTAALMPPGAIFTLAGRRIRLALGNPIPTHGLKSACRAELTSRLEAQVRAALTH